MTCVRILLASTLVALCFGCRASSQQPPGFVPSATSTVNAAAGSGADAGALADVRTQDSTPLRDPAARAALGQPAPDFELIDLYGRKHTLSEHRGKIVVLEWFDPACPAVVYAYGEGELREQKARKASHGIVWIAINSSAPGEEGADPRTNREFAAQYRLRLPILMDPTGVVGRAYGAHTVPHFFVINERGLVVYSGALDNAPRGRVESLASKSNFVDLAIADLRSGHAVLKTTTRPYGCEIKYARP